MLRRPTVRRFFGFALNATLALALGALVLAFVGGDDAAQRTALAALAALYVLVNAVLVTRAGGTAGHLVVGLRVRTPHGERPGLKTALVRELGFAATMAGLAGIAIGMPLALAGLLGQDQQGASEVVGLVSLGSMALAGWIGLRAAARPAGAPHDLLSRTRVEAVDDDPERLIRRWSAAVVLLALLAVVAAVVAAALAVCCAAPPLEGAGATAPVT